MRHTLLFCLLATAAHAADASFDLADQHLREENNARACDELTAFLKANPDSPLVREAPGEAREGVLAGRPLGRLVQRAAEDGDAGEKDFARAYAAYALAEQGYSGVQTALPLLKQAASGDDRVAREALEACSSARLPRDGQQQLGPQRRAEARRRRPRGQREAGREGARAAVPRAREPARESSFASGEKKRVSSARATATSPTTRCTSWRRRYEQRQKFVAALELYDGVVKRFSADEQRA